MTDTTLCVAIRAEWEALIVVHQFYSPLASEWNGVTTWKVECFLPVVYFSQRGVTK